MNTVERKRRGKVRGTIQLEVQVELFTDDGGNDRLRVQAYFEGENGSTCIGGVDIMPYPPNPLFGIIPHATPFTKKGIELAVSSALLGAAGPLVGECINNTDDYGPAIRRSIEGQIDNIADAAFESALRQVENINEPE